MENSAPSIKILIAAHKPYAVPKNDLYLPICVGQSLTKTNMANFIGDDTGKNISRKNPVFCELTALYWAWKNLHADYIGLVHYRRYFKNHGSPTKNDVYITTDAIKDAETDLKIIRKLQQTLSQDCAIDILKSTDVILPKKRHYYIENLYDHYCKTMNPEPLIKTRQIIADTCPKYLAEFDKLKIRRSAHMFNMFIMKKEILDQYCSWIFSILFELEKQIDATNWSNFQKRYAGRVSELLLDIWLYTNQISYKELPVVNIEPVNWPKKCADFLQAKFFNKKYERSF